MRNRRYGVKCFNIMKECKICGFKKSWNGSDIECCFQKDIYFTKNNWNCGIINEIRDLCEIENDYRINYQYCDDQKYCSIKIDDVLIGEEYIGLCLWVSWYKSRGKTDGMWILDSCSVRKPVYKELRAILDYYNGRG